MQNNYVVAQPNSFVIHRNYFGIHMFYVLLQHKYFVSQAIDWSNNCFQRQQINLFDYKPRNLPVALKMQEELENWLDLEQQMKQLSETSDPDSVYEKLKSIDEKTEKLLEKQADAEKNASLDAYDRKAYIASRRCVSFVWADLRDIVCRIWISN